MNNLIGSKSGFTLVELLVGVIILGFVFLGLIQVFLQCALLTDLTRNKTLVMSEIQGKMEEIRNHDYASIPTDYASSGSEGNTFDLTEVDGKGVIYVDSSTPELLEVKVVASWENKDGRVVGEDLDLDGELDSGEDADGDGDLSSIATLIGYIAQR